MRQLFGAGVGDFAVQPADGLWGVAAGVEVTFWDAVVDGIQYTDLLDATGEPISSVVTDEYGALPAFQGPDGVTGMWASAGGGRRAWIDAHVDASNRGTSKGVVILAPTGPVSYVIWRAPSPGTVTAVRGYRTGGTGVSINATRNGLDLLAADLSLSTDATWLEGPTLQNETIAAGDSLAVAIRSTSGAPSAVTIQIDMRGL